MSIKVRSLTESFIQSVLSSTVKMFLQNRILYVYSLVYCTLICSVVALKCDKLHSIDDNPTTEDQVFNEGIYRVKTKLKSDSAKIQELITSLKGISNVNFSKRSFTAILQPKHIKKVSNKHILITYH